MNQSGSVLESPDMRPPDRVGFKIYLASNSPRRKELLSIIGLDYLPLAVTVDEASFVHEAGVEYVKRIANAKAQAAARQFEGDGLIIAADTVVVDRSHAKIPEIFGKPADAKQAIEMLHSLRGHTHKVFTAITIVNTRGGKILSDLCMTNVPMRNYSDAEIDQYVASGDPLDKAGAYAIQHAGFHPVEKLTGCFANVMGLPLCHLARSLSRLSIVPSKNVPLACQAALGYACSAYPRILKRQAFELVSN